MKKQYLMYPAHGIVEVLRTDIKYRGRTVEFTVLKVLDSDMVVMLPSEDLSKHTRQLVNKTEAKYIRSYLNNIVEKDDDRATWNRRYREYMETIRSGDLREISKVYNILKNSNKNLSFGERKIKDYVKQTLETELSIVLNAEVVL